VSLLVRVTVPRGQLIVGLCLINQDRLRITSYPCISTSLASSWLVYVLRVYRMTIPSWEIIVLPFGRTIVRRGSVMIWLF